MSENRAEGRSQSLETVSDALVQSMWTAWEALLGQQGWAAALVTPQGRLLQSNTLFRHQCGVEVGALHWRFRQSEVECFPAIFSAWRTRMRAVTLLQPGGLEHLGYVLLPLPAPWGAALLLSPAQVPEVDVMEMARAALDQSAVGALMTDAEGRIIYVNRRLCEISGYNASELLGASPNILQSGRTPRKLYQELWSRLHAGESWEGRILNRKRSGEHYWSFQTISPLYDNAHKLRGYLSLSHDTTSAFHEDYLSLHRLAYYDSLCGIANRSALQKHLHTLLETEASTDAEQVALLFINLDNFKLINDGYGHEAGDTVLQVVCERIVDCNYLKGFVARLGGDEFALVIHGRVDAEGVTYFADALLRDVTRPIEVQGDSISVSASVGMALAPEHADEVSRLMKCADTATRAAKSAGRNRAVVFRQSMLQSGDTRIAERGVLTRALEFDELYPVFQPVVSCNERRVSYYESLVRWQHPELGALSPVMFLPAFQQFGLLTRLNDWMLDHACAQLLRFGPQTCLSLNVAATDLMLDDYAQRVLNRLRQHGVEPTRIRLEITEGELIENFGACERSIDGLRAAGVRFYIDDFGVGYASLAYLKRLPVDGIKLDRSFLQDFPTDAQTVDIVASVIGLAHRLDLEVTAEGVEEMAQARLLAELGCDYLQGFLFGKPGVAERLPQRYL